MKESMKKKIIMALPFLVMPVFIPIYVFLDGHFLVEIFGCGCPKIVMPGETYIPFNANDVRAFVFTLLTIGMSVWGIFLAKKFDKKWIACLYCLAVLVSNILVRSWVITTFWWD